ncbi:MarR family transcriptional regulator [Xylophilus rhododendri]|uniref:MarR family transcriptional regulator n=1 Tax=Xylophilus rhododendri TaxID=2697032 RepID=A0A857J7Y6_9BURK|nr:MarR family transcriptional regulator [Xylophilus rhododendri]QHI99191.1 MarR family transcriptional regulator [Xylophilus rhododendri]
MKKRDFSHRFSFLVSEVAKLYGEHFDRLARARLGLSKAQCKVIGTLAMHGGEVPLSQAELAQRMGLSAMSVATMCERMEAAGWLRRETPPNDRRTRWVHLEDKAHGALDEALKISDEVQKNGLAELSAAERTQLVALLQKARSGLQAWQAEDEA